MVDAPRRDFAVQVPLTFIRSRRPRILVDPAPNALTGVRYTVQVGGRTLARNLNGTSFRVNGRKLRDGRHKVVVTAIDGKGQRRTGTPGTLRLDRHAPRVKVAARGEGLAVRIADGHKGKVAGVKRSSVRISFGDGKRARGRARRHRYRHRGAFTLIVKATDRAGNHLTMKRRVTVG